MSLAILGLNRGHGMAEIRYTGGSPSVRLIRIGKVAIRGTWLEVPDEYAEGLAGHPSWETKADKPKAAAAKADEKANGKK